MSKSITPILLVILSIGIYFTFTEDRIAELKEIQEVNNHYTKAIEGSEELIQKKQKIQMEIQSIPLDDQDKLHKMIPNNVDNIRLIIDINGIASRYGFNIKNIKAEPSEDSTSENSYNTSMLSFSVSTNYQNFISFLRDIESSLRLVDISKIDIVTNDTGISEYKVQIKTYWY